MRHFLVMLLHYPLLCLTLKWISWDATHSSQKVLRKAVQILMCLFSVVKSEKLTYSPVVWISTVISVDIVRTFHFECKNIRAIFSGDQGDEGKNFVHGISDQICPSVFQIEL